MANPKIRRATKFDAPALTACLTAAYAGYRERIPDMPEVTVGLAEDIRDNLVWVAELEARVVGGIVLSVTEDRATLVNVAVHPDASGLGLGRALIATVEEHARSAGLDWLHLATHVAMPENVTLYERLGWVEGGRKGSKVMMSKRL